MAGVVERRRGPTDYLLFNVTLALLVVGIVMVFDSSYARSMDLKTIGNDAFFYLKRQAVYAIIGVAAMLFVMRRGYWNLRRLAAPMLLFSFLLLIAVWIPHVGMSRNGAARWVGWGPIQVQPSEVAKLSIIIYLAALLSRNAFNMRSFQDGLLAPLCVVGVFVLLVDREPDLGTAAVIGLSSLTMLYLAGAKKRHLAAVLVVAGVVLIGFSMMHGYRKGRVTTFLNPEADYYGKGYQLTRGLVAVGSGGVTGVGLGAGREKFYLPEANTDFIFATIAEETGLWGSVLVLGLLFVVGWRAFLIGRHTRDTFGAMLAAGIASMISWQALINVAVVTGSIPATGVPLPFVSYGGSSLVFVLVSIGILLNIAQHPDAPGREPRAPSSPRPPLRVVE